MLAYLLFGLWIVEEARGKVLLRLRRKQRKEVWHGQSGGNSQLVQDSSGDSMWLFVSRSLQCS